MNREKLEDLCRVLEKVIVRTAEIYNDAETNQVQKALLETMLGAAIWYLPGSNELYSGKISKSAEEKLREGMPLSKLTKEHGFPRKQAGKELLSELCFSLGQGENKLGQLYLNKYGKFNLVLSRENKDLIKFQKDGSFVDDETSYKSAKIELLERSIEHLKSLNPKSNKSKRKKPAEKAKDAMQADEILATVPQLLNEDDNNSNSFAGIVIDGQSIIENGNPNNCYVEFMNFIIVNYNALITGSLLLSKYLKRDRNDPAFEKDSKYPHIIKTQGDYFFSSHASVQVKKRRIINIANEIGIQVKFLYQGND